MNRVAALEAYYREVQTQRMQGLPVLNPALSVEAVGFEAPEEDPAVLEGVLITPWFMSLVRLPLQVQEHAARVGRKRVVDFGNERFDFIGANDAVIGFHESCALFSPMGDFRSQDQARDTATEVLAQLRPAPQPPPPADAPVAAEPMPSRRAFFMARRPDAGGRSS